MRKGPPPAARRKPVRHVFGRLRNVEVGKALFTFELTKAGLRARRRNSRRVDAVGFDRLANGGGFEAEVDGRTVAFALTAAGLEVRRRGAATKLIAWAELANHARDQALLFPEERTL